MISDAPEGAASEVPTRVELAISTDCERFAGIGDGRKFEIMPLGIHFVGKMPFDTWRELLFAWNKMRDLYHIGLADILNYGRTNYGEEQVDQTLELLNFDMADALKAHAIGQIPMDIRVVDLTAEHYYVLAKCLPGSTKEQGKWAAIAQKHKLSANELKKSIEQGKVVTHADVERESGRDSGLPNIEGLGLTFQRWEKQVGGEEKILEMPADWKKRFLQEVLPITELAKKVEESLPVPPAAPEAPVAALG